MHKTIKWHPYFLLLLLLVSSVRADTTHLEATDKQHLLKDSFQEIRQVKQIPLSVQREFDNLARLSRFEMADPEQKYQAGDVIIEQGLPLRRLIFASLSSDYCLIHYERGGFAHCYNVVLFRLSKGKARFIWGSMPHPQQKLSDFTVFRESLAKGKFDSHNYGLW